METNIKRLYDHYVGLLCDLTGMPERVIRRERGLNAPTYRAIAGQEMRNLGFTWMEIGKVTGFNHATMINNIKKLNDYCVYDNRLRLIRDTFRGIVRNDDGQE